MDVQIQAEVMECSCKALPCVIADAVTVITVNIPFVFFIASAWSVISVGNAALHAIPAPLFFEEREVTSLRLIDVG